VGDVGTAGILSLRANDRHPNCMGHIFLAEEAAGISFELRIIINAFSAFPQRCESARDSRRLIAMQLPCYGMSLFTDFVSCVHDAGNREDSANSKYSDYGDGNLQEGVRLCRRRRN
jgi:hypothetical protein